ncbi:SET and MYND domain-containing protein 4 isoform X1 [Astyanax mexicanus]|uniref:SET and MYND domain-containing protein 4 isoform X1 n=2 Tax=Astyanax mexicanus TaxID=7994 RepID=UPI0020CAC540|nr:SET and MYND domain-containing protein 4 isoform X1 [Astyanax mexicanus]
MDLPCPEWIQHVEQVWSDLGSSGRQRFSFLKDLEEILNFTQSRIQPEDLKALSRISESFPVRKSAECSVRFRERGNLSFKVKDYTAAALCYSRGVCHARKNTEPLSLCYANRSAALFHLGHYSKCMEDIQRALDEGYPNHLQGKLLERRTQCVNRLKEQKQSKAPSSKHQTQQTAEVKSDATCLPNGVSVLFTPEKGRYLLATEDKTAGDIVVEDEAFSFVLIPDGGQHTKTSEACLFGTEHQYCHHCLCKTLSAVPCLGCSYAQYCGQMCANKAWKQYHFWECPAASELLALGVLAHLALRVTLKAGLKEVQRVREVGDVSCTPHVSSDTRDGKSDSCGDSFCLEGSLSGLSEEGSSRCSKCLDHSSCFHGGSYLGVYSLLPHVVNHPLSMRFLLAYTLAVLCQRLKEVRPSPETWTCSEQEDAEKWRWGAEQSILEATALRHLMQLRCNAQAVTAIRLKEDKKLAVQSSGEVRIATAVFPILSLLNHSCSPNTSISFSVGLHSTPADSPASGVRVTIRTCKDIAAGQELLHCYGPHCSRMDVRKRQHLLLEQYFFHCNCEACKLELASGTAKQAQSSPGLKCEQCGSSLQASEDVKVCSQLSCDYQISDIALQTKTQMLQDRLHQAVELLENDRVDEALRILKEASTQADNILMKTHPVQGELADATARVYATMGDWRQAASHLKRSVHAVRSQYGEDSVELGRQLFKLAQLHFNGRDRKSALSVIPRAQRLLSLHCDPHCEELQELQEMEDCLHRAV